MLTDSGRRVMLRAFLDAVVEAGWGTNGASAATNLTNPRYTTALAKGISPDGKAYVEYAISVPSGSYTVREVGLFGRDQNGNRVLLLRLVRDPTVVTHPVVIRDRIEVEI